MAGRVLLLVLLMTIAEGTLLVTVAERIGFGATAALVVGSALFGVWIARRAGTAAWRRVQERLAQGAPPGPDLVDGLVVLLSAVLLVVPGFLTDAAALLGLFPPTRALARRALVRRFERGLARGLASGTIRVTTPGVPFGQPSGRGPTEVEVEDAEVLDDGRPRTPLR